MQTIDSDDLVSGSFEACAEFAGIGDDSPVCGGCGWLETEHGHGTAEVDITEAGIAEVRPLPTRERRRQPRAPKRLAS